jgi:addiction module RelE/StbE family toxin
MKLQYTPQSVDDLQRLRGFVASKNPLAARKIAIEIQDAANRLKVFPKIGLPVSASPDPDSFRDLYMGNYTIRYQIASPEQINVLRIWHNKEIEKDL